MQEAATLKQQYDALNDVLERADMPQMLDALLTMRKSMGALERVPEFSGVADKVAMLESRLKALAVPKLADALREQNGELRIDRLHVFARLRCIAQMAIHDCNPCQQVRSNRICKRPAYI